MGDKWPMEREQHVQRPECKELPGPQEKEEGGVFPSWSEREVRWSSVLSGMGLGDHFTAGETGARRKEEPR